MHGRRPAVVSRAPFDQPFKNIIGAKRPVTFQQKLQNSAACWRELQLVGCAMSLGNRDHVINTGGMIMLFKSNGRHTLISLFFSRGY